MKIEIDTEKGIITRLDVEPRESWGLGDRAGFEIVSKAWLRAGWDAKHVYTFTWLGRPIIQLPEDLVRIQEVIYRTRPTTIIETGVAHGGGCIFFASLLKLIHSEREVRVIGVDIEIRKHNRHAIESHELFPWIELVEGSSTDPGILASVSSLIGPNDRTMVVLDSCHSSEHVLSELRAYAPLVSDGCYLVATDGIMKDLVGAPRSQPDWALNNPYEAARKFAAESEDFILDEPAFLFDESGGAVTPISYWPSGYLKKSTGHQK